MRWPDDYKPEESGWSIVGGVGILTVVVFLLCICVGLVVFTHHVITGEITSGNNCVCEEDKE